MKNYNTKIEDFTSGIHDPKILSQLEAIIGTSGTNRLNELIANKVKNRLTIYDDPVSGLIVKGLRDKLAHLLTAYEIDTLASVIVTSFPSAEINARRIVVPKKKEDFDCKKYGGGLDSKYDRRIVLINTRLLEFFHETIKLLVTQLGDYKEFSETLKISSEHKNPKLPDVTILARNAYISFVSEFLMIAPTGTAPLYYSNKDQFETHLALLNNSELFAYAHEISHILLNHKVYENDISLMWKQELEADYFAFKIMLRHYQKLLKDLPPSESYKASLAIVAPIFVLQQYSILKNFQLKIRNEKHSDTINITATQRSLIRRIVNEFHQKDHLQLFSFPFQLTNDSHPPSSLRAAVITELVATYAKSQPINKKEISNAIRFVDFTNQYAKKLFTEAEATFDNIAATTIVQEVINGVANSIIQKLQKKNN